MQFKSVGTRINPGDKEEFPKSCCASASADRSLNDSGAPPLGLNREDVWPTQITSAEDCITDFHLRLG
jgi:hypothetical protein